MCLAVPSKIVEIRDGLGTIDADGVIRKVSLLLLDEAQVGDYVIVHAGFALHKIDEEAALESLNILREALALTEQETDKAG
jgi:hydrogenase expression/formation protein HypC